MREFLLYGIGKGDAERWQEQLLATGLASPGDAEPIKARAAAS